MENKKQINLEFFVDKVKKYKKVFMIVLPIVFVFSTVYIFSLPRYYVSQTSLAPEIETPSLANGAIGSIASSFGLDLNNAQTTDAITPLLYPDLMKDNKFVVDLFKINVKTLDDSIHTDYYTFLTKYKKESWISKSIGGVMSVFKKKKECTKWNAQKEPYMLSKDDDEIVSEIRQNVKIAADKQTGVISVFATSQDPLVSKILADAITEKLKGFIVKYRTSKAQKDVEHYKKLMQDAQSSYEATRRKYAAYADANNDVILESVKSQLEDIENDMQLKYNQYTAYNTQYQAAVAKLREQTPVFTKLQGASVPTKPDGPKRILSVIGVMLFTLFVMISWIVCKQLLSELTINKH